MPRVSWRIMPARTRSLWLTTSASAGSSLSVGIRVRLQRTVSFRRTGSIGRSRRRRLLLSHELLDLFHQRIDDLNLGNFADDFTLFEDEADPLAAGDSQLGGARLAGAVHFATHDCDVNVFVRVRRHALFDFLRERDEIDVGASARRARDEGHAVLAQPERFQNLQPDAHLLDRIGRQRDADSVSDALGEQRADADGGFDRADSRRPRLGDSQMKRVIDLSGEHAVCLDHHERIGGLERNFNFRIVQIFENVDVAQRAFDHAFGGRTVIFLQQVFFEGAGVDADADRDFALGGELHDFFDAPALAYVARIETEAVDALLKCDERELVVEMYVGDERNADAAFDLAELLGRFAHRDGDAHDVAAGRLERPD